MKKPSHFFSSTRETLLVTLIAFSILFMDKGLGDNNLQEVNPASDPNELATHLLDGQNQHGTGKISQASTDLAQAAALYAHAVSYSSAREPDHAIEELQKSSQLAPDFADTQVRLANLFLQTGKPDEALKQLQEASLRDPDSPDIQAALSYCIRLHGRLEEADKISFAVLQRDPGQVPALRVILEDAVDQGDLGNSVKKISALYQSLAGQVTADNWISFAHIYDELARSDINTTDSNSILNTLADLYQSATAIQPPSLEALRLLGETYHDLNQPADYLRCLQKSKTLDPTNTDLLVRCAALEEELDQPRAALVDYETAYREDVTLPGVQEALANLNLSQGHYSEAADFFQTLAVKEPTNLDHQVNLGICYAGLGDSVKSNACFLNVYKSDTDSPEPFLKLASFQISTHDLNESAITLKIARERFPDSAYLLFLQGVQFRHMRNYSQALVCLEQAREMALKSGAELLNEHYFLEVATTEALAGHRDKANSLLLEARAHFPGDPEIMNQLAYFYSSHNEHLEDARALAEKAVSLRPTDGQLLDTLGWIYFQQNQAERALPYLQQACELTNNEPGACLHLGVVLTSLNRPRQAIEALDHGLTTDPDNSDIKNQLSKILSRHASSRSSSRS